MKYNLRSAAFTAVAVLALSTGSARAAQVTLTFEGFACNSGVSGITNATCTTQGQSVGSDYGSVSGLLTVLFGNIPGVGGSLGAGQGQTVFGTVADFGVVENGNDSPSTPSQITFTPAAGFEVSLFSFANRRGSATFNQPTFTLLNPSATQVFTFTTPSTAGAVKGTQNVNSAYFAGPITFQYGAPSGVTVVDDIVLDVRAVSNNPVPEPSTWATLGFGLAALVASRRRR